MKFGELTKFFSIEGGPWVAVGRVVLSGLCVGAIVVVTESYSDNDLCMGLALAWWALVLLHQGVAMGNTPQ